MLDDRPVRTGIMSRISMATLAAAAALAAGTTAAQPVLDPRAEEVIEAAFQQQIGFWLNDDARRAGTVVCLTIEQAGESHSVTQEYLKRFPRRPEVRRGAECEARKNGAVERATGKPAILLTAGGIKWITPDEAWVDVRHFRTQLSSGAQPFRVVRELSRWVCLGPILLMPTA
jgi:hypothetical protein